MRTPCAVLEGFSDERVFAVSCQIFFSDPNKLREETGLTQAWWRMAGCAFGIASRSNPRRVSVLYGAADRAHSIAQVRRTRRLRPSAGPFYLETPI